MMIATATEDQKGSDPMPIDQALLDWAEYWYPISWKGILLGGVITAVGACATIAFLPLQWRTTSIREEHSEWRTSALELQTAEAKRDTAAAHERIAELNNQTERLKADNLAVQKAMLPRRLAGIRMDRPMGDIGPAELGIPADAPELFTGMQKFNVPVWIQAVTEYEPEMLALDLKAALELNGVKVRLVDQSNTNNPDTQIPQGIRVLTVGTKASPGEPGYIGLPFKPVAPQADAAALIGEALTKAEFGTAGLAIGATVIDDKSSGGRLPYFNPRFEGVLVQIGRKPLTLDLYKFMKAGGAKPKSP
jgi:hypothetical protein